MINLYLHTPLHNNSDFIPHLIEHSVFGKTNLDNFFKFEKINANCSTYYTYYQIDTDNLGDIKKFIELITSKLSEPVIDYEYDLIKKECLNPSYAQKITQELGKILYGANFKYLSTKALNYEEIYDYHKQYYKKENIIILNQNKKFYNNTYNIKLELYNKAQLTIEQNNENLFVFKNNIIEYYSISILASLFDYSIKYQLRFNKKVYDYSNFYTVIGDFEDYFYISIHGKIVNLIKNIDNNFINQYIKHSINNQEYLSDTNLDGSFIVKYGYTLSNKTKIKILKDTNNLYKLFVSKS